jgi:hypothetical protein
MQIPVAIDFSKIYAEKVLYSETIQYKILKDMGESEWKTYKSSMLKENVNVSYDATTDAFIAKPLKESRTLTEARNSGNLRLASNVVNYKQKTLKEFGGWTPGSDDFHGQQPPKATTPCECGGVGCDMCEDDGMMNEYENSEMEHYGEKTGQLKEEPLDDFSNNRTEFGHINEDDEDDEELSEFGHILKEEIDEEEEEGLSEFGHIVKESQNTKKNLLMDEEDDEEDQDEDDFDGSMDKLLNFDDAEGDEEAEEEGITDEDDIQPVVTKVFEVASFCIGRLKLTQK